MTAVDRYDVAMLFRAHWRGLTWRSDEHARGVYFGDDYGYLIEKNYAVRVKHDQDAPETFYIPDIENDEDEVIISYPYVNLKKTVKKFQPLFEKSCLEKHDLEKLFDFTGHKVALEIPTRLMVMMLEGIAKKRERERAWFRILITASTKKMEVIKKESGKFTVVDEIDLSPTCVLQDEAINILLNANHLLGVLKIFSGGSTVFISHSRDRIVFTSENSIQEVEGVISLPKDQIVKNIQYDIDTKDLL